MNELCFLSNLSSSEWASWVQAIGSIAAIAGAVGIAIWQAKQQHKASLDLLRAERRMARVEAAKAFLSLSTGALRLLQHSAEAFPDRESVHDTAEGRKFFDLGELKVIEGAVQAISLQSLPHELVRLAMIVSSTVRQFRENVELSIQRHRQMDAENFKQFFDALAGLSQSLKLTCDDIKNEVHRAESEA
ncbi:hypothetical protein [Niveibacterium sp.]|uniref:hypothetical protein n=1 Tax=Niveibacterium sp. TaxID=2017444 RepID=UPI0035B31B82